MPILEYCVLFRIYVSAHAPNLTLVLVVVSAGAKQYCLNPFNPYHLYTASQQIKYAAYPSLYHVRTGSNATLKWKTIQALQLLS